MSQKITKEERKEHKEFLKTEKQKDKEAQKDRKAKPNERRGIIS